MVLNFAEDDQKANQKFVESTHEGSKRDNSKNRIEASDGKSEDKKKKKSCKVQ